MREWRKRWACRSPGRQADTERALPGRLAAFATSARGKLSWQKRRDQIPEPAAVISGYDILRGEPVFDQRATLARSNEIFDLNKQRQRENEKRRDPWEGFVRSEQLLEQARQDRAALEAEKGRDNPDPGSAQRMLEYEAKMERLRAAEASTQADGEGSLLAPSPAEDEPRRAEEPSPAPEGLDEPLEQEVEAEREGQMEQLEKIRARIEELIADAKESRAQ